MNRAYFAISHSAPSINPCPGSTQLRQIQEETAKFATLVKEAKVTID